MPVYVKLKNKIRQICTGDLDRRISIFTRSIVTPGGGSVDYTQDFSAQKDVWAMLATKKGEEIFDGINIKGAATHLFYIRYYAGVTAENWILFAGNYYNILSVENLDERSDFLCLKCTITGDIADPVAEAGND